jgi:GNAT superfamily N-acetyltransferase
VSVEALERACLDAWPPAHRETRHGWEHCATEGKSGRVNAVWPLAWTGDADLTDAIEHAAAWCVAHAIAPRFKIVEGAAAPAGLQRALVDAGFRPATETLVMTAPVTIGAPPAAATELYDTANEHVWSPLSQSAPDPADYHERIGIVGRIKAPHVFALVREGGAPGCSGMGVLSGELVGIYLMRTAPWARRRGFARDVLNRLLHWGATHEARLAYLQVEAANEGAVALYANAGFTTAYRYFYWTRQT